VAEQDQRCGGAGEIEVGTKRDEFGNWDTDTFVCPGCPDCWPAIVERLQEENGKLTGQILKLESMGAVRVVAEPLKTQVERLRAENAIMRAALEEQVWSQVDVGSPPTARMLDEIERVAEGHDG
jgi:hypothetical protein